MEKTYWELFYFSLIGCVLFLSLLLLMLVFMRKLFFLKKHGLVKLATVTGVFLFLLVLSGLSFVRCCMDYHYVMNGSYEEAKAKVLEFTYSKKDYDGNGEVINAKPKFLIIDQDECIVLNAKGVELGATYLIRYYPNTKICEVLHEIAQ